MADSIYSGVVPNGAILTYTGNWPPGIDAGFVDYTGTVFSALVADGLPLQGSINGGFGVLNAALGNSFQITFNIQVQNGVGYGSINDVISIIRGEVYAAAGAFPNTDSIPTVQIPGGASQVTGQVAGAPASGGTGSFQCGDPSWSFLQAPGQWFSCLTQKGLSTLGLVFIGLALGIVLLLFAKRETGGLV